MEGEEKHTLSVAELASHNHSFGITINSTETGVWKRASHHMGEAILLLDILVPTMLTIICSLTPYVHI